MPSDLLFSQWRSRIEQRSNQDDAFLPFGSPDRFFLLRRGCRVGRFPWVPSCSCAYSERIFGADGLLRIGILGSKAFGWFAQMPRRTKRDWRCKCDGWTARGTPPSRRYRRSGVSSILGFSGCFLEENGFFCFSSLLLDSRNRISLYGSRRSKGICCKGRCASSRMECSRLLYGPSCF